jgi:hypothetical protein
VRNSGFSSSSPSRIFPKRLRPRKTASTRKPSVDRTNIQPKFSITQPSAESAALPRLELSSTPHSTNATQRPAAGKNTHGSTCLSRGCRSRMAMLLPS